MDRSAEDSGTKAAALVTAGVLAGAGIAAVAALYLTRKGPFAHRELSLRKLLASCDQSARLLESRLPSTA